MTPEQAHKAAERICAEARRHLGATGYNVIKGIVNDALRPWMTPEAMTMVFAETDIVGRIGDDILVSPESVKREAGRIGVPVDHRALLGHGLERCRIRINGIPTRCWRVITSPRGS